MIKPEIRVIGFDDSAFEKSSRGLVPVIGVIFRGGKFLDGILKTEVEIDGLDATEKIVKLINSSRHKQQLKVIMFDGITLAGFNLIDIKEVNEKTNLPVIVINRKMPNLEKVKNALKNFSDYEKRWEIVLRAGKVKEHRISGKKIYYQCVGISEEDAKEIINLTATRSLIPEPLRVAHLIATAIVRGESYGRA